jgi:tRNA modification GTPase
MTPTHVAVLTPPGKSALATLGIRGPRAWPVIRALFRPRSGTALPDEPETGRYWLGRVGGDVADEGIVAVRAVDPIPTIELHVHGGREVVRYLVELFDVHNIQLLRKEEFVTRQIADPLVTAAVNALTKAMTMRTASILLDQYHGALSRQVDELRRLLAQGETGAARVRIADLLRWSRLGLHLTTPFRLVVAGAPNVGKSSLVNALAGYDRCIVSPTPGTTRDVVTTTLALDGWPVELCDTAGLRHEGEALEAMGIQQAREAVESADLCLWLLDASTTPLWPIINPSNLLIVVNKIDLVPAWDLSQAGDALCISATTGEGISALCDTISQRLVPESPASGTAIPFTLEHINIITDLQNRIEQ